MISNEQWERWARLYDLGHRHFRGWNFGESEDARAILNRDLKEAYQQNLPGESVTFLEFKRNAIRRILARLNTPPPTL